MKPPEIVVIEPRRADVAKLMKLPRSVLEKLDRDHDSPVAAAALAALDGKRGRS